MTVADMKAAVALAVEQALGLIQTDKAPAVAAPAKPSGDALREKRLAALAKARAAKKAKAKPVAVAEKPATTEVKAERKAKKPAAAWTVKPHTTKKGVKGLVVNVGPFSCWLPEGDKAKYDAAVQAINGVFRTEEASKVWAKVNSLR